MGLIVKHFLSANYPGTNNKPTENICMTTTGYFTEYVRSNLVGNDGKACLYDREGDNYDDQNNGCQIFRLGDMVRYAGGNFAR